MLQETIQAHFLVTDKAGNTVAVTHLIEKASALQPKDGHTKWLLDGDGYKNIAGKAVIHGSTDLITHT